MPVELRMPKLGLTMEAGRVVEWKKREGDPVKEGEVLLLVETEKITNEIKSPASGVLARIVAKPGEEVPVGGLLAIIATSAEEAGSITGAAGAREAGEARGKEKSLPVETGPAVPGPATLATPPGVVSGSRSRVRATPAARRIAHRLGVDLASIKGTGPRGMITVSDVERAVESKREAAAVAPSAPRELHAEVGEQAMPAVDHEVVEMSPMRARIADNLYRSYSQAVHTTLHMEACVDELLRLRDLIPEEKRPSITAFIVKAAADALARHSYMNSGMVNGRLVRYKRINVGVAVALEDGLVVPVIRDADKKTLGQVWGELQDLSRRAREGRLSVEEVEGSTFSVSNLGMYGVDSFTPIIYPGHAGVLGVGRLRKRVDEKPGGGFVVRNCLTLSLTFDHRVVDGAQAALFLSSIKKYLENPVPPLLGL